MTARSLPPGPLIFSLCHNSKRSFGCARFARCSHRGPLPSFLCMITMRDARASSTRVHCCSCVVGKQLNRYCSRFRADKAPVRCRSGVARQLSQPPSWLQARHRRADEGGLAHGAAVLGPSPAPRTPVGRRPIPDSGQGSMWGFLPGSPPDEHPTWCARLRHWPPPELPPPRCAVG